MKILFYLPIFMVLMQASNGLIVNEIMADPIADETLNEWVEIYNNNDGQINVSGFIIGDDKDNDTIEGGLYNKEGAIIEAYGFAVITDDATRVYNNFNVSPDAVRLYVDDSSIGNGLSNDGETIYLYDSNKNFIYNISYNRTTPGLSWAYLNESLHESDPSPGFSNDNNGNIAAGQYCDYAIVIIIAKTAFENSSEFSFKIGVSRLKGLPTNFTARAKIDGLSGNLIREYIPFTNESVTNQRTSSQYSPNLEEGNSYILNANLTVQCNDSNYENNFDNKIITIKGKPPQEKSSISISEVYDLGKDKTAKFGQIIRIKLNAYKGNTNKETVAVWIEHKSGNKLSKQSKTNLDSRYMAYSLTLPVQIEPNCDEEFKNGNYIIKAQGLDSEDEEEIEIGGLTGLLCEAKISKNSKNSSSTIRGNSSSSKKFNFWLKEFDNNIEIGKEFSTRLVLDNNGNKDIRIKAWSYVYRGSKSYSGERERNRKEFVLKANSLQILDLSNVVENAEPGNYKLKFVVNKDNQKTNEEITKDVTINENNIKTEKVNVKSESDDAENPENPEIGVEKGKERNKLPEGKIANGISLNNHGIVYQSATEKAKSLVPAFLIILLAISNIIFIWKR